MIHNCFPKKKIRGHPAKKSAHDPSREGRSEYCVGCTRYEDLQKRKEGVKKKKKCCKRKAWGGLKVERAKKPGDRVESSLRREKKCSREPKDGRYNRPRRGTEDIAKLNRKHIRFSHSIAGLKMRDTKTAIHSNSVT